MVIATAPNWAEIITAVGSGLGGLTLFVGGITAWILRGQLGESRMDRHLQWIAEIGRRWDDEKMEESRIARGKYDSAEVADLIGRWLDNDESVDDAEIWKLLRVPNFLEDVALTVEVGKLEPELVFRTLAGPVQAEWEFWQQSVQLLREDDPWTWIQLEKLAADLRAFSYVPVKQGWWQRMSRKRAASATS